MTANYSSQQPRDYSPELAIITQPSTTWGATANACTITDASIHPSSCIVVTPTGIPAGNWKQAVSQGQLIITSSDAENSTLGLNYRIL